MQALSETEPGPQLPEEEKYYTYTTIPSDSNLDQQSFDKLPSQKLLKYNEVSKLL